MNPDNSVVPPGRGREDSFVGGANTPRDVKSPSDVRLPYELAEGFQATFVRLRRMFRARGVPLEEAADLAQETIVRTLLHLRRQRAVPGNGDGHGNGNGSADGNGYGHVAGAHGNAGNGAERAQDAMGIDPLLRRIAMNLLIDRARAAAPQMLPIEGADEAEADCLDPSDEVARRQQQQVVHHAINDLSVRHRTAMLLSLEGLTPAEIADHFGIGRNAADALLYRARRRLAKQLGSVAGLIRVTLVLVGLRLRALGRRAGTPLEPVAASAGQFALGLTALVTLGAVIGFSFTSPTSPAEATRRATRVIEPAIVPTSATHLSDEVPPAQADGAPPATTVDEFVDATVDPRDRRVSTTVPDPTEPEEDMLSFEFWEQDDGRPSLVADTMDAATEAACSRAAGACAFPEETPK